MPARTNSEKIEASEKEIIRHGFLLERLEDRFRIEVGDLTDEVRTFGVKLNDLTVRFAALEQRISHVEKLLEEGRTRRWQVWLAFIGAILSGSIAIIVAFAKR